MYFDINLNYGKYFSWILLAFAWIPCTLS